MPAIDPKTWSSLRALEAAGEPGFLLDLVSEFLLTVPDRLSKIKLALQKGDDDALEREAHAFKSSCGALGALSAARALDELETLGREKRAREGAAPLAVLERDLDEACGELRTAVELP